MEMLKTIAMWSGPRNLSTAMMYSFAQREDCDVWDEPFYAAYLHKTGLDHPMRQEILAAGDISAQTVINKCLGVSPNNKPVFYQKHMTQHMIEGIPRDWVSNLENVFLIRHPARVLASYDIKRSNPSLADIGFSQQIELVQLVRDFTGQIPLVIDCADIRANPAGMLKTLCTRLAIPFDPSMLSWSAGGCPQDGVWASHWYGSVWQSTGFAGVEGALPQVRDNLAPVLKEATEMYNELSSLKVAP